MKKVILLIGDSHQANASGFIKEFDRIGAHVDKIICLQPPKTILWKFERGLRFIKKIRPQKVREIFINWYKLTTKSVYLSEIKKQWENKGENSWDLLEPGLNFIEYASSKSIPFHFASSLTKTLIDQVIGTESSIIVLYAGGIIRDELLSITNVEFVNAHMGDMPKYRGMNVLEWAVLEEQPARVSVMIMNKIIDGGDVIYAQPIPVSSLRSIKELREAGYKECYKAMARGVFEYQKNEVERRPQEKNPKYYYRMHPKIRHLLEMKLIKNN